MVDTDSRKIRPGSIFFALKGGNFDGNQYALSAINKGAAYAIVDDVNVQGHEALIHVENVLCFLQKLANHHRNQLNIPILAITGTNGKTTTKELVSSVLAKRYKVSYTQGNFNNHIGVPLTLLNISDDDEFAVVEMGANHSGEIDELCRIAEPDYGLITNVGKAHLEGFGSFEGVIQTKTEMYRYIRDNGKFIFVNRDNQFLQPLAEGIESKTYGIQKDDKLWGCVTKSDENLHVKVMLGTDELNLVSQLNGNYNLENILAAVAIGKEFGVKNDQIVDAIRDYTPKNNRSQLIIDGARNIVMDAYNANPSSMMVAITNLLSKDFHRALFILGDMKELGDDSSMEHKTILDFLCQQKNIVLYAVGEEMMKFQKDYDFHFFSDVSELNAYLDTISDPQEDWILIKGSRGIQLELCLPHLVKNE